MWDRRGMPVTGDPSYTTAHVSIYVNTIYACKDEGELDGPLELCCPIAHI